MKSKIFLLLCLCGLTACSEKKSELDLAYEALDACLDKVIADTPKPQNTNDLQKLFEKEKVSCEWFGWENAEKKYYPINTNFTEDELSEIEKYNIQLIYAEEQKR